ncbi:hypothetical protein CBR_g24064 [Chara braunii]|uniref:DNA-binding protein BIN4 n=1 Tax=Chara braunii TaxID=69332 RepID=A0A388L5S2_CHABU|nr:hypothetical protein CBR_g24064 [Chara braunii]|eukprot:GBG77618.1 hypothetical protein CBR_g24064 [Chara braunii]
MVNSRESSPDWLHDFQAPAPAAANISSSTSDSYGVPSWSAGGTDQQKPGEINREGISSDDEPLSKFKHYPSSEDDDEDASGQGRDLLSSKAKVKATAKKRTSSTGLDSDEDEDESPKENAKRGRGEDVSNGQGKDGSIAKKKKLEGSGRGRGEGGGRGRGASRGAALGAEKKLSGEAKRGAVAKVNERKGRGRGATGLVTGVQKQSGLDKWLGANSAGATPIQDIDEGKPNLDVNMESSVIYDAVVRSESKSVVSANARMDPKVAVKKKPPAVVKKGLKDGTKLGGIKEIKEPEREMQTDVGSERKESKTETRMGGRELGQNGEMATDADAMMEDDGEEEDGAKGADVTEDLKKKGKLKVLSRLPLMLPDKISRLKVLMECDSDAAALDLSGDVGAVGRFSMRDAGEDGETLLLDIKGTVYKALILPSTTCFVVNVGATEAKIESIMNDFMLLQEERNIFNAETMVEGTLDDVLNGSDSELGVARKDRDAPTTPGSGKAAKGGRHGVKQKDEEDNGSEMYKFSGGESGEEYTPTSKKAKAGGGSSGKGPGKGGRGGAKQSKTEKDTVRRGPVGAGRGKGARAAAGKASRVKGKSKGSGKPRGKSRGSGGKGKEGKQRIKETFKGLGEDD